MTRSLPSTLFVAGLAAALAACGGAAPPEAASPAKTGGGVDMAPAPEPATIDEAQKQIAAASDELGGHPKNAPPADVAPAESGTAAAPTTPAQKAEEASVDMCANPCRALASMRRAVDALCRMAGDTDKRCTDARQTLADSVTRTSSCKCSS